jgi:hypothetical protein
VRHYGLEVGQEVLYPVGRDKYIKCRVVALHTLDNNGCALEVLEGPAKGTKDKGVCEWCKTNMEQA